MTNRTAKLIFLVALAFSPLACDRQQAGPAATAPSATKPATTETNRHRQFAGIDFILPPGWTAQGQSDGLLLLAPDVENDWQANVFLELLRDRERRNLEQALNDLVPNLKSRKNQFRESSREMRTLPSGLRCATLEYTQTYQGTALTDQETIIEFDGDARFFVYTSTATSLRAKYQPIFRSLVDSLHVAPR